MFYREFFVISPRVRRVKEDQYKCCIDICDVGVGLAGKSKLSFGRILPIFSGAKKKFLRSLQSARYANSQRTAN